MKKLVKELHSIDWKQQMVEDPTEFWREFHLAFAVLQLDQEDPA